MTIYLFDNQNQKQLFFLELTYFLLVFYLIRRMFLIESE